MTSRTYRYAEIDIARSLAILGMVVYHTVYDLAAFYGWDIAVFEGGWKMLARATAILFLFLVGVSFAVSWERRGQSSETPSWASLQRRIAVIFAWAMMITLVTYIVNPETYVRFGILHCIALSTIGLVAIRWFLPVGARHALPLPAGVAWIVAGQWTAAIRANTSLFLPLGITYPGFATVDYFPLLPWFGVVLIGYAIGDYFYVRSTSWRLWLPTNNDSRITNYGGWLGRHSLAIYLLHQPILLGILWLTLGNPAHA